MVRRLSTMSLPRPFPLPSPLYPPRLFGSSGTCSSAPILHSHPSPLMFTLSCPLVSFSPLFSSMYVLYSRLCSHRNTEMVVFFRRGAFHPPINKIGKRTYQFFQYRLGMWLRVTSAKQTQATSATTSQPLFPPIPLLLPLPLPPSHPYCLLHLTTHSRSSKFSSIARALCLFLFDENATRVPVHSRISSRALFILLRNECH